MKILTYILTFLFLTTSVLAGTATYDEQTHTLTIAGQTDSRQAFEVYFEIKENGKHIEKVIMYGPGGRADSMVEIMKDIKELKVPVVVPENRVCASACALIVFSADSVIVDGTLLFHMGYYSAYPPNATLGQILKNGQLMAVQISKALQKAGMKLDFLEKLIRYTGPGTWYVVTSYNQIKGCKVKNDTLKEYMSSCYISAPIEIR